MDTLELFHPVTKKRLDFDALSYQELLDLEILCQDHKSSTDLKIEAIEEDGREVPVSMQRFSRYCGLTILMSQKHRSSRANEAGEIRAKVYRQLLDELVKDKYLMMHMEAREKELFDQLTARR